MKEEKKISALDIFTIIFCGITASFWILFEVTKLEIFFILELLVGLIAYPLGIIYVIKIYKKFKKKKDEQK